jgi:hypothetical protein
MVLYRVHRQPVVQEKSLPRSPNRQKPSQESFRSPGVISCRRTLELDELKFRAWKNSLASASSKISVELVDRMASNLLANLTQEVLADFSVAMDKVIDEIYADEIS